MWKLNLRISILYLVLLYAWIIVFHDHEAMIQWGSVIVLPVVGAGIGLIWQFQAYRKLAGKQRYVWFMFGAGSFCFIAGQFSWYFFALTVPGNTPFPSSGDAFWLLQYIFTLAAMVYNVVRIGNIQVRRFLLDVLTFMATAVAVSAYLFILPIVEATGMSAGDKLVSIAYPVLDLALLFIAASLSYIVTHSRNKLVLLLVGVGLIVQIIADSLHLYLLSINRYEAGGVIDPLWLIPLLLIGVAGTYAKEHPDEPETDSLAGAPIPRSLNFLPYGTATGLVIIIVFLNRLNHMGPLEFGLIAVILLIIARQLVVLSENRKLLQELQMSNAELAKSEERYRHLVEIYPYGTCVVIDGKVVYINKAGLDMYGAASPEEMMGKSAYDIVHLSEHETVDRRRSSAMLGKQASELHEYRILRADGQTIYVESSIAEITFNGQQAFLSVAQDITKRRETESKIKNLAFYDELTGLFNRSKLHEHLAERVESVKSGGGSVAVLFIDLDRFKFINDSMGHSVGDLLLRQVSRLLVHVVEAQGTVYRFGGDEFCVILDKGDRHTADSVAQRMVQAFTNPFLIENREFFTTPSIGISMHSNDGEDMETLIRLADIAMYDAKKQGGNRFRFYDYSLDNACVRNMNIEMELRKAITQQEFILHYQPKVDLATGKMVGLEALVRWRHSERGLVPPLSFIPVAEETGLIVSIGQWVLTEACRQLKNWHDGGFTSFTVSVNLSPRQFQDKDLIAMIARILVETGLEPRFLEVEVTESIMKNMEESVAILNELKRMGIRISIDDFGTGYSSLHYLKHLPIDSLKIDKSFVDDITKNFKDEAIVRTIIDMGHQLNLDVTAEGIEYEDQLNSLVERHCNVGQGYFFSKPLSPEEAELLFDRLFV